MRALKFCAVFTLCVCTMVPTLVTAWLIIPWFWP